MTSSTTKIAVVVRDDTAVWQRLNMTAFLVSGIAARRATVGEDYQDGSGQRYLPMFAQPVLVYVATIDQLRGVHERATRRELDCAVYTADLFRTSNDVDNRAAVRAVPTDGLDLTGLALYGPRNGVDKACKGLSLHP
ncbi:DUF2000 domain-containing protein [Tamaricihabitans halophyticus]|nr:DUF2000 domain-containing protein [Tamaricihabitans halophyticus]